MFNTSDFVALLKGVASDFGTHAEELRQLDAVIGDGDLGVTIELGCRALSDYLASPNADNIGQLPVKCGLQFNKASPSTFGTLLASGFMGAGKMAMGKETISLEGVGLLTEGAVDGIKKMGKAELGDKTMLDCLVPAVEALKNKLVSRTTPRNILQSVLAAAEEGMKATIPMMSKHGRAVWHRENTIGVQDAGATAMFYLIEAFVRNIDSRIDK